MGQDGFSRDVVGVGAFNIDYLTAGSGSAGNDQPNSLGSRIERVLAAAGIQLEWGTEHAVDERTIYAALAEVDRAALKDSLGGSAFNAIYTLAHLNLDLRLGFLGLAGRVPIPGQSGVAELAALGVDHQFVRYDPSRLCGICFALQVDGERTLLTHAGANSYFADYLDDAFDDIVDYLSATRVVHVTSFLDDRTAGRLEILLRKVKSNSPDTLISFDPGHVWSQAKAPEIDGILGVTDFLLVNSREFRDLGNYQPGDTDEAIAGRLLRKSGERMTVILKRPEGVVSFELEDGSVRRDAYQHATLSQDEIKDATGAGDVFAAGLLAATVSDRQSIELGSALGMALARHKLRFVGTHGHGGFATIARQFIGRREVARRGGAIPRGVFVAHGGNPQWRAVKAFIEDDLRLPVYSFESGVWGGTQVTDALDDLLERCGFAVCVLTAEDLAPDGEWRARQNVIHEVGLFQGRYGFDRVILLVEEGIRTVPRTADPFTVAFPRNRIDTAFWRLRRMVREQMASEH
ncbi:MAG TPA: PfkB family carbohydrate kinase [Natronosporangium sp.]